MCSDKSCVPAPLFDDLHKDILKKRCAPCHTLQSKGGLSLKTADIAFANLVEIATTAAAPCTGRTRVVPGDPGASVLHQKISVSDDLCGKKMPVLGSLSADQVELFRAWIAAGAIR